MFQTSKDIFIVAKKKLYSLIKNDNFKFNLLGDLNDLFVIRDFVDSISEKKETFIKKRSLEIKESVN